VAKKTGVDPAAKEGCSLWVRNIATTTRANDLKTHFSQFGAVSDLNKIYNLAMYR
jgi:RNA recognition motif-containing protein